MLNQNTQYPGLCAIQSEYSQFTAKMQPMVFVLIQGVRAV